MSGLSNRLFLSYKHNITAHLFSVFLVGKEVIATTTKTELFIKQCNFSKANVAKGH